jgi:hypothetical protein
MTENEDVAMEQAWLDEVKSFIYVWKLIWWSSSLTQMFYIKKSKKFILFKLHNLL